MSYRGAAVEFFAETAEFGTGLGTGHATITQQKWQW
jgi:hypothetical protein